MFLAKKHIRPPRRGPILTWLRHGPLLLLLILLGGYSPAASAAFDAESCLQVQDELKGQLNRKFKRTDKAGLADRRKQMNHLAQSVSNQCAWMLLYKVGDSTKHRDPEFRELVAGKLARPTIEQFIDILGGQACCADDDLEHWGKKFASDAERDAYIVNYFDDFFDDFELDRTQSQSADPDAQCVQTEIELTAQLNRKFTSADKKGLADRRKKLNTLFENTSEPCATTLRNLLSRRRSDSTLSTLFHHKLASATREELLNSLDRGNEPSFFRRIVDGTSNQTTVAEQ